MTGETGIDLSGEQDPTEKMVEKQDRAVPDEDENQRKPDHNGDVTTEEFDLSEALAEL